MKDKSLFLSGIIFLLFFLPFVNCVDFDGDGIDDGEQDLCGDYICQTGESETCPIDCEGVSEGEFSLLFSKNNFQNEVPSWAESAQNKNLPLKNNFFNNPLLLTIFAGVILFVIIIVIIFILRKKKSSEKENVSQTPKVN
jgi:hypothetical protein